MGLVNPDLGAAASGLPDVLEVNNDAGGAKITGLGTPTDDTDAATKGYADAAQSAAETYAASALGKFAVFFDKRGVQVHGGATQSSQTVPRMLSYEQYNGTDGDVVLQKFAIVGASVSGSYIEVEGDQTAHIPVGRYLSIYTSTSNDKPNSSSENPYIASSVTYYSGTDRTRVVFTTAVASDTADGYLFTGRVVLQPGSYLFEVFVECGSSGTSGSHVVRIGERTGNTYSGGAISVFGTKIGEWSTMVTISSSTYSNRYIPVIEIVTVAAGTVEYWEVQHWCSASVTNGMGRSLNVTWKAERYCRTKITKIGLWV